MHPYLSRLKIRPAVQAFFEASFSGGNNNDLIFPYGDGFEHFGFGFHLVPSSENFWMAGNRNLSEVAEVVICGSALDAVAWLNKKYPSYSSLQNLLFLSVGAGLRQGHIEWVHRYLKGRRFVLLFGKDVLGSMTDLKLAAGIRGLALEIFTVGTEGIAVQFRSRTFLFSPDAFSLNAFERASGFRFNVSCQKPRMHNGFFVELKAASGLLY